MKQFVSIYNNATTKVLAEDVFNELIKCNSWKKSLVYGKTNLDKINIPVASDTRTCSSLPKSDPSYNKMCDQIDLIFNYCVNDYAEKYNATLLDDNEKYSYGFVQYKTGEYYSIHSDDAGSQMRKISTTLYLNDDYLGGELFFDKINFSYKPKMGDLIIFPSSFPFSHEAKPVTNGTKYCVIKFWT